MWVYCKPLSLPLPEWPLMKTGDLKSGYWYCDKTASLEFQTDKTVRGTTTRLDGQQVQSSVKSRKSNVCQARNRPYPLSLGVQNLVLPVSLQDEKKLKVPTQESITTKDEEYLEEVVDESNKAQNFKTVTCPATFFQSYWLAGYI